MRINKLFNRIAVALAMTTICVVLNPVTVKAAADTPGKTYTVSFRPGNVGKFDFESIKEANQYAGYSFEETKNGAIKVTVPSGAYVQFPSYVIADEGYFPKGWNEVTDSSEFQVTKNSEFVADYGRLIDGVEYQVKYLIQGTETSVRPIYDTKGNNGEVVSQTAPKTIEVSEGAFYILLDEETKSITLSNKEDAVNEIVFEYKLQDRTYSETEETLYTDGGIVITVETVAGVAPIAQAPAGNAGVAPQAVAPEETEEAEQETVEITTPETALSDGIADDTVTIEIPDTAKDAGLKQTTTMAYVLLAVALVVAIAAGFILYNRIKTRE